MGAFKIQFDYTTILALISLSAFFVVILLIKVIYRHNPHEHEHYGDEIVLFHSIDRYKKRVFRFHLIEDLRNLTLENKFSGRSQSSIVTQQNLRFCLRRKFPQKFKEFLGHQKSKIFEGFEFSSENKGKIDSELELKVIMGEFSEDAQEIVRHAVNHKFGQITIIAGPRVFCEDRTEIYTLLDKYKSVRYYVLPKRPNKHFIIFHRNHLYIEKPHRHNESRGSVGIKKSNPELIEIYESAFNKFLKYARPLTKEEVLNQQCYKD